MTMLTKTLLPSLLAATFALAGFAATPAQARGYYRSRTIVRHYIYPGSLTAGQRRAKRLHREAVRLDHQATYEDQHGHPKVGEQLAHQASHLNALAYRAARR